ncbi:helix-turn-helix domain-containing protein [Flavobacterium sp. NST-5]|uniref:Helix-turn-helix domain-containing protein n=1 Tax=Flavobacterium ichthyis TaxID=2698827 RepID=A0ABW9ZGK0_9FLAO|nr:helix-turn-helix domain-containing protein [Flavobacterium ichthyis]NBL65908.1 helix-turn-helix domain-containing protein [Flavobacterium ichthyis]
MNFNKHLYDKQRQFGLYLVWSVLAVIIYFLALSLYLPTIGYKLLVPIELLVFTFIVISYTSYIISKTSFEFKTIYRIITISITIIVFIFSLFISHASIIIYFYYIPIVMLVLMLTNLKRATITALTLLFLCYLTPTISKMLGIGKPIIYSETDIFLNKIQDYSILGFVTYFSFLILYFSNQFNKIQTQIDLIGEDQIAKDTEFIEKLNLKTDLSKEKVEELSRNITDYFSQKKPFKNPEFNLSIMAKDLNTNTNYLSRVLADAFGKSFRDLVNEYRVNYVVEKFNESAHKKFTIEHLYIEAGFEQQSTFNRVFKKHTGFTPSQYIDMLEK